MHMDGACLAAAGAYVAVSQHCCVALCALPVLLPCYIHACMCVVMCGWLHVSAVCLSVAVCMCAYLFDASE